MLRPRSPHSTPLDPELEDEFPREVQIRYNAEADRRTLEAGLPLLTPNPGSDAFLAKVRERLAELNTPAPETVIGFVSQNDLSAPEKPTKRAEINRQNAAKSTGPKSIQGKMASSRNSTKHGLASGQPIIAGEDSAAFDALVAALTEEHHRPPQPKNC